MRREREMMDTEVAEQMVGVGQKESLTKNPTVLSCGGIYIPHRGQRQAALYHIINTPSKAEPVKVVSGIRPKNVLHEVLIKESLN